MYEQYTNMCIYMHTDMRVYVYAELTVLFLTASSDAEHSARNQWLLRALKKLNRCAYIYICLHTH